MNETQDQLLKRAKSLKLYGLISHWDEVVASDWLAPLLIWEERSRSARSLERRLKSAKLGRFKTMVDFDWDWPKKCDRPMIESWLKLGFIAEKNNLVLCGPNGVGKSMIMRNVAHQSVLQGHTALFVTAGEMLTDLAAQDGDNALARRIKNYARIEVLIIDEIGYLSFSNRHADLLFEIIRRRYELYPTLITTNKPFSEWGEIFPNASCVVSLIDRLVHHSEIVSIEADSFRLKEAKERREKRKTKPA